jgi:hypothetical protein
LSFQKGNCTFSFCAVAPDKGINDAIHGGIDANNTVFSGLLARN